MQRLVVGKLDGVVDTPHHNSASKGPVAFREAGPFSCRPAPNDGGVGSEARAASR
jgi:hypothetical protein